jgi:Domain of unknown function (DUF5655)
MWVCPTCGRSFRNANQSHSCKLMQKEDLFAKRPPEFRAVYKKILSVVKPLGKFREESVPPDIVFFKTNSTFLAVKIKRDHVDIEFFLDHLENIAPVSKYLQTSTHRFVHMVSVDSSADIDSRLANWIKQSYQLILSKKSNKKNQ